MVAPKHRHLGTDTRTFNTSAILPKGDSQSLARAKDQLFATVFHLDANVVRYHVGLRIVHRGLLKLDNFFSG